MFEYEYLCTICKQQFKLYQNIEDFPSTTCQECGKIAIRLFFPLPITFNKKEINTISNDKKEYGK